MPMFRQNKVRVRFSTLTTISMPSCLIVKKKENYDNLISFHLVFMNIRLLLTMRKPETTPSSIITKID